MAIPIEIRRPTSDPSPLAPRLRSLCALAVVALAASCSAPEGAAPAASAAPALAGGSGAEPEAAVLPPAAVVPPSDAGGAEATAVTGPEGTPPEPGTAGAAAAAVAPAASPPATGPEPGPAPAVGPAAAGPSVASPPVAGGAAITAATRRTAEGLPEPIPAYQTWYRLPPSAGGVPSPHLALRQAYISVPSLHKVVPGQPLPAPLPEGTTIVLEAKSPGTDFIEEVSVLAKGAGGWRSSGYARSAGDLPFAEVSAPAPGAETCAGCHAPEKGTDGVYSTLRPE